MSLEVTNESATVILESASDLASQPWPVLPIVDPDSGPQLWLADQADLVVQERFLPLDPAKGSLSIGRDARCDLHVAPFDAGGVVSRTHARLQYRFGYFSVEDLESLNGTWWNQQKLSSRELAPLRHGDKLVFGAIRAVFVVGERWQLKHQTGPDAPASPTLIVCPNCGKTTPGVFSFCVECGSRLMDAAPGSAASEDQAPIAAFPSPPPPPPYDYIGPPPPPYSFAPPPAPPNQSSRPKSVSILDDRPALNDQLDFSSYSHAIAETICSPATKTPVTFGIFGHWGSGKTTLMRMLETELRRSDLITIWFNAWQYSHEDELWAAFLQSLLNKIRAELGLGRRLAFSLNLLRNRFRWSDLPEYGLELLWRAVVVAAPLVLAGPVAQQVQPGIYQFLLQAGGGAGAVVLAAWVMARPLVEALRQRTAMDLSALRKTSDYEKHIAFLDQFREHFTDVVHSLPVRGDKRLAVFVDDLDRCPTERVLQVLDAIHLFVDIPGCIYILGLDRDVIQNALASKYPDNPAAQREYVGKIIQLPFQLPPLTAEEMQSFVARLAVDLPDPRCRDVFVQGLAANPREIKRILNMFSLLWNLAAQRAELAGVIQPVRLAKVVAIQHSYPDLHGVLQDRPHLLIELENYFRGTAAALATPEGEPQTLVPAMPVSPLLQPFAKNERLQRMLLLQPFTPGQPDDANFAGLKPEGVSTYFTLTVGVEAPEPAIGAKGFGRRGWYPGETLNSRYQIVASIGRGGMSTIYKAFDKNVGRTVAVKMLEPSLAGQPSILRYFLNETRLLSQLSHPNLVQLFDAGQTEDGDPYYVMELLGGGDLRQRLKAGPLATAVILSVLLPVLDCLAYLHRSGVVHRDVKPGTIVFTDLGMPKVTDLSIAKVVYDTAVLTETGGTVGTPMYMAPEQWLGQSIDSRADLYAFGVVLYECLTGQAPFPDTTMIATLMKKVMEEPLPLPSKIRPDITPATEAVVVKLLAKDPANRYQTAAEVTEALLKAAAAEEETSNA